MRKPKALHRVMAERFSLDQIADLCTELGVDFENLGGTGKSGKAREMVGSVRRKYGGTDGLIATLADYLPDLDLQPYLYLLIQENFSSGDEMKALCESYELDCKRLLLDELGLFNYSSLPNYLSQQALVLQKQLESLNRVGELVLALRNKNPLLNLESFERLIVEESPSAIADPVSAGEQSTPASETGSPMAYENFDLRIRRKLADGRFPIEVTGNPENIEMDDAVLQTFPLDDYDFTDLVGYLEDLVARAADAKELGGMMRELLFPPEVWEIFFANLNSMRRQGKGLRIRLRVDAPELSRLPWEYCYDKDFGFFALKLETPIVRYIRRPFESKSILAPNPLKVLVAISAPSDYEPLKVDQEEKRIRDVVELMGERVELTVLSHATDERIRAALTSRPHIFHFIGHGTVEDGQGVLVLEDRFGQSDLRDAEQMMVMLAGKGIHVAVLNACKSAAGNAHDAFSRVAPALVKAEIPAVIAMQFSVPDEVALGFTRDLYLTLMSGFPLDMAITEMRIGAFNADKYFWGIPSLFMRAPDGVLWEPDPQMRALFDRIQAAAPGVSTDSLVELVSEIMREVERLQGEIGTLGVKVIMRGLEDSKRLLAEAEPDLEGLRQSLSRVIEDSRDTGSDTIEKQLVPKVEFVLKRAADLAS
jgi:hypothetical protein